MDNNSALSISGKRITKLTLDLNHGWSLISYLRLNESNASEFSRELNVTSILAYNGTWLSYNQNRPDHLNTLKTIKPGYGYWVTRKLKIIGNGSFPMCSEILKDFRHFSSCI